MPETDGAESTGGTGARRCREHERHSCHNWAKSVEMLIWCIPDPCMMAVTEMTVMVMTVVVMTVVVAAVAMMAMMAMVMALMTRVAEITRTMMMARQ